MTNNGAVKSSEKPPTFQGVPYDKIEEAAVIYSQAIPVRIQRRNPTNMRISTLGMFMFEMKDLPNIEEYCRTHFGGGIFTCDPRRPDNVMQQADPLPKFTIDVEGIPKPASSSDFGGTAKTGAGARVVESSMIDLSNIDPEEFENLPHYMKSPTYSLKDRVEYIQMQREGRARLDPVTFPGRRDPVATQTTYTSDTAMKQHAEYVAGDLAQERAKHAAQEAVWQAKFDKLHADLEHARQERIRVDAEARDRASKAEMDSLRAQIAAAQAPKASVISPELLAIIVPAAAGIFQTMLQTSATRQANLAEQQTRTTQLQMESVNSLLTKANAPQPDPLKGLLESVIKLAPILAPAVTHFIDSKSPKAQAELYHDMVENHMNSMTMIAELTEKLAQAGGGEDKWYMPVIQQGLNGIMEMMNSISKAQRTQVPIPQSNPRVMPGVMPGAARQPISTHQVSQQQGQPQQRAQAQQTQAATQQQSPEISTGERVAQFVMAHSAFPADMKLEGWYHIIVKLHNSDDPQQVAEYTLSYINQLIAAEKMPESIRALWVENPLAAIAKCIEPLPVAKNEEYCKAFFMEFEALLNQPIETTAEDTANNGAAAEKDDGSNIDDADDNEDDNDETEDENDSEEDDEESSEDNESSSDEAVFTPYNIDMAAYDYLIQQPVKKMQLVR